MQNEKLKKLGQDLRAKASRGIGSADSIISFSLNEVLHALEASAIKNSFSEIVENAQARAYQIYLEQEGSSCSKVLAEFIKESGGLDSFGAIEFTVMDSFFTSLSQSRKTRAGGSFEKVVTTVFERLRYPFTPQPNLGESRPDYVIPSLDYYEKFAADCIIFTCKRTLRERWRQIVTEGTSGKAFFLATIDENISAAELDRMKDRSVYLVVPSSIKVATYAEAPNVISFERFLIDHLDPAIKRWQADGVI